MGNAVQTVLSLLPPNRGQNIAGWVLPLIPIPLWRKLTAGPIYNMNTGRVRQANYYSFGAGPDGASTSATSSAYGPKFDGQNFYQLDPATQKQSKTRTPWVPYKNQIREFFETGKPKPTP
jgi:hypothetical protein